MDKAAEQHPQLAAGSAWDAASWDGVRRAQLEDVRPFSIRQRLELMVELNQRSLRFAAIGQKAGAKASKGR